MCKKFSPMLIFQNQCLVREPLIKYKTSLQDLKLTAPSSRPLPPSLEAKHAAIRRSSKLMAPSWRPIVLNKSCNNIDARFKPTQATPCPTGLSGWPTLGVIVFRRDQSCHQNDALIVNQPESQSRFRLDQRFPSKHLANPA